jgi:hypothetical protein
MKIKILFFLLILISVFQYAYSQDINFPKKPEYMKFLVHYGVLDGGEMELLVDENLYKVDDKVCHHVSLVGKTIGSVDWFTSIRNEWHSYIDTTNGLSYKFTRNIKENKYAKVEQTVFDRATNVAIVNTKLDTSSFKIDNYPVQQLSQDMISAYFAFRFYDFEDVRKKDTLTISVFIEDKLYDFKMRYLGKEKIKTIFGKKTKAIVICPILPPNKIFSGKDAIKSYFSDDEMRLPLKVKASLFVGSIEVDLVEYR